MEKLKIIAIDKPGSTSQLAAFEASINPEQLSLNKAISFKQENPEGTGSGSGSGSGSGDGNSSIAGTMPVFQGYASPELQIQLYFDSTGVIDDKNEDVPTRIQHLEEVVYEFQGDKHGPHYLLISWGTLQFQGQLKSIKTDYTLFDTTGKPLRAKVAMSFVSVEDQPTIEDNARKSSPDLSHFRVVRAGDRLPLMANSIYGSIEHYIQVAQANGLTNFRDLELGSDLMFPPIEK